MTKNTNKTSLYAEGAGIAQAVDGAIATVVTNVFQGDARDRYVQRYRQKILERLKSTWIEGVLEHSLQDAEIIELELEDVSHLVDRSLGRDLQTKDILSGSHQFVEIFDRADQALLVLGEPGSGKTTMLLNVARTMLIHAQANPLYPVPIILNLSSWSNKRRKSFEEWLTESLKSAYGIPSKIARLWINNDDLALLLDGLDEIKQQDQESCIKSINRFRHEHSLMPILICSRAADYKALHTHLKLQGGVSLRPLTIQQINTYLSRKGNDYAAARWLLQNNSKLLELSQLPLMFNMILQTYQRTSVREVALVKSVNVHSNVVFRVYVAQMHKRLSVDHSYSLAQVNRWLAWLAFHLSRNEKTEIDESSIGGWFLDEEGLSTFQILLNLFQSLLLLGSVYVIGILGFAPPILGLVLGMKSLWQLAKPVWDSTRHIIVPIIIPIWDITVKTEGPLRYIIMVLLGIGLSFILSFILIFLFFMIACPYWYFLPPLRYFYWVNAIFLYVNGCMPWNYEKFLKYAVDLNVLHQTGYEKDLFGRPYEHRYKFIHQLLMDFFASSYQGK